jgi:rRNA maturation endonuclease Nob1
MVKCEKCDTEIPDDNQFCGKCGAKKPSVTYKLNRKMIYIFDEVLV